MKKESKIYMGNLDDMPDDVAQGLLEALEEKLKNKEEKPDDSKKPKVDLKLIQEWLKQFDNDDPVDILMGLTLHKVIYEIMHDLSQVLKQSRKISGTEAVKIFAKRLHKIASAMQNASDEAVKSRKH